MPRVETTSPRGRAVSRRPLREQWTFRSVLRGRLPGDCRPRIVHTTQPADAWLALRSHLDILGEGTYPRHLECLPKQARGESSSCRAHWICWFYGRCVGDRRTAMPSPRRSSVGSDDVLLVEQGSLYPALHRLIKRGLITFEEGTSENNRRGQFLPTDREGPETARGRNQQVGHARASRWPHPSPRVAGVTP